VLGSFFWDTLYRFVARYLQHCESMYCGFTAGLSASEPVSRLQFTDEQCQLSCGRSSGMLTVWDLRAGLVVCELPRCVQTCDSCSLNQTHMAWTCDRLAHNAPMTTLLLLASDGHVTVTDVRGGCQKHDVSTLCTGQTFSHASYDYMTVRVIVSYITLFSGY